jgi:hypothetical protein
MDFEKLICDHLFTPILMLQYFGVVMHDDPGKFIDKVIWGILGTIGMILVKYVADLNETNRRFMLEISKLDQQVKYHEQQIRSLRSNDSNVFRIETEMGMHEKRIRFLEKRK